MKSSDTQTQDTSKTNTDTNTATDSPINASTTNNVAKTDKPAKQKFYDFYLEEHQNIACRRLHFAGSTFGLLGLTKSIKDRSPKPLIKGIAAGYACAWVGHFFFEKNKPATFKYPLQSFASDIRMYGDIWRGNVSLKDAKLDKVRQK